MQELKPSDIIYWLYSMRQNTDGTYFAMFQFDQQFKGNIDEVKYKMLTVKLYTESHNGGTKIRFSKLLINLNGTFDSEFGSELHKLFLERMKNKPNNYGY